MFNKRELPTGRYFRLQCKLSHCPACEARYPKCEDKEDGFHIVPEVGFTPRYMICKGGRTIALDSCNGDKIWGVHSFPYNGKCTHMYALPSDFFGIGRLPSCKGKLNGNYQFPDRPCDAYYQCKDVFSSPVKCPNNTVFDSVKQICEEGGKCIMTRTCAYVNQLSFGIGKRLGGNSIASWRNFELMIGAKN
uniref:Uncharacterized protein n=1 Tax=Magallana gigas TaxID=29159 RepID=K1PEI4_MAGGI